MFVSLIVAKRIQMASAKIFYLLFVLLCNTLKTARSTRGHWKQRMQSNLTLTPQKPLPAINDKKIPVSMALAVMKCRTEHINGNTNKSCFCFTLASAPNAITLKVPLLPPFVRLLLEQLDIIFHSFSWACLTVPCLQLSAATLQFASG